MRMARGTFYLMVAEATFVLSGWVIHVGAGRILGDAQYGIFVLLLSLLTHYRIFLATGVNRAVSKYVSEEPSRARVVQRQALKLQLALGVAMLAATALCAPLLARLWQKAELTGYIRLTAFFFPAFGIYSVYRGSLNGFKLFGKEALVENVYSLFKVAGFFALVYSFGVSGAVIGYLLAIVAAIIIARLSCPSGGPAEGPTFPVMKIVEFAFPVVLFSFIISLLQSLDLYFIQAVVPPGWVAQASSYYGCAQQFSRVPYLLLYALSLTLFPNISASTSTAGQEERTARIIRKSLRSGLLFALPLACLIGAQSAGLVGLVYGDKFLFAARALRVLVFGHLFLSFLMVLTTILTASGRPWLSFALVTGTLGLDAALNYLLVRPFGIAGAAAATTLASAAGMSAAAAVVWRRWGTLLPAVSALRIGLGAALLYAGASLLAPRGFRVLPVSLLLLGGYFVLLALAREIDRGDLKMIQSLMAKEPPE